MAFSEQIDLGNIQDTVVRLKAKRPHLALKKTNKPIRAIPVTTGTVNANAGNRTAIINSKVARIGFANPPVVAVEPSRKKLVKPFTNPAEPPLQPLLKTIEPSGSYRRERMKPSRMHPRRRQGVRQGYRESYPARECNRRKPRQH